jgi:hypothetical protein
MQKQIHRLTEVQRMLAAGGGSLIITSDEEMEALEDNPGLELRAFGRSMAELADTAQDHDHALINVAYDFFFGGEERNYFPTSPQCIRTFRALHDVARERGVGFGASVLSPLDLGPGYYREKGRGSQSFQFQEGVLRPDGSYEVPMRVQRQWFHNKGPVPLHVAEVRAYAFSEERIPGTHCYAVDPNAILDVSASAKLAVDDNARQSFDSGYAFAPGVVSGKAQEFGARDRVLAVIVYDVEEMDYFAEDALPYLKEMLDAYKDAGVSFDSFYSDEMHIQFDWDLRNHFGTTEITTRHLTPGLIDAYCQAHGDQYADFARYLVYFAYGQHGFLQEPGAEPEPAQHVFGPTLEDIHKTWQFRRDYFTLLTNHVVDLFIEAKRYGEGIFGRDRIWTRAHATWQEAPTCDHTNAAWAPEDAPRSRYDYTPAYDWSSSIRENVSACYNYFRWGDFLTGMGTDHPEGGYIDRNYYGAALACSFGKWNDVPYSYHGHWGAPQAVSERVRAVAAAMGLGGPRDAATWVQGWEHRSSPVLAIHPLDLNYVEERFGTWTVQYGYCDYITDEQFAEWAEVLEDGRVRVKDQVYGTVLVLFQPLVERATLGALAAMANGGGRVVWTGPAPARYKDDAPALEDWRELFGLREVQDPALGLVAEAETVHFQGRLGEVEPFEVLTHLLVDQIYPVSAGRGTDVVASVSVGGQDRAVGTVRDTDAGGLLAYLGARPRDDQSGTTPDAPRALYELLAALGAYEGDGWAEVVANSGPYMVCRSPNGAVSVAPHYYAIEENWPGGFFRQEGETFDESLLPAREVSLDGALLANHHVTYRGDLLLSYRLEGGDLVAFAGAGTTGIVVDEAAHTFADKPLDLMFAPLPPAELAEGIQEAWVLEASPAEGKGALTLTLPLCPEGALQWASDTLGNGRGEIEPANYKSGESGIRLTLPEEMQGVRVYLFVQG